MSEKIKAELNRLTAEWHTTEGTLLLREYLKLTEEEYNAWVLNDTPPYRLVAQEEITLLQKQCAEKDAALRLAIPILADLADAGPAGDAGDPCGVNCAKVVVEAAKLALSSPAHDWVHKSEVEKWKDAIEESCIVAGVGATNDTPRELIHKLICWNIKVALDPRVSQEAAELHNRAELAEKKCAEMRGALLLARQEICTYDMGNGLQNSAIECRWKIDLALSSEAGKGWVKLEDAQRIIGPALDHAEAWGGFMGEYSCECDHECYCRAALVRKLEEVKDAKNFLFQSSALSERDALQAENERLSGELSKANNEFGSQCSGWPDLWKRIADLKAQVVDAKELTTLKAKLEKIGEIAHDYIPDNDSQAPQALAEMREALTAAIESTPILKGEK